MSLDYVIPDVRQAVAVSVEGGRCARMCTASRAPLANQLFSLFKILTSSTWTECEGSPRLVCPAETSELVELHHLHDQGIPHVTSGISLSLYNK